METENGKINYRVLLDTSGMAAERDSVAGMFADMGKSAQVEGTKIDDAFSAVAANIGKAFASLMAVSTFTSLSKKIMAVRGEFQQLEVAFETMLGSAEKANNLMNQLVHTAAITPFGLQDVAGGAKQLLAYGIAAEEVNDTLVRLGDIAAGLSIPLNDLVYLYGTTMTQGRVFTQDMRQFMGRGIPVAEELAKQFGVTKDKVNELVTAGKVGFPEIKKAIISMTSEGGKFGGLMEKQSHTITGQLSNIDDAIDMMFNDLGKQSEGVINTALGAVTFLIEHYQQFGTIILSIVAAYGEYKAALMVISAYNSYIATQEAAIATEREAALAAAIAQAQAENAETAATTANTAAKEANKSAIDMEVAAIMRELEMKAGQAAIEHDLARQELVTAQQRMAIAEQNLAARQQEYMAAVRSGNMSAVATARANLETAAKERQAAATQLNAVQANIDATAKAKEAAATRLSTFQTQVDTANKNANTAATGLFTMATNLATRAVQALGKAFNASPFGFIMAGLTLILGAVSLLTSRTEEQTEAMTKMRDAAMEDTQKLNTYVGTLNALHKDTKTYKDTLSNLRSLASEYNVTLEEENGQLKNQEKAYNELSAAINRVAAEKVLAEAASEANKKATDAEKEAMDKLIESAKGAHNIAIRDDNGKVIGAYQGQLNTIAEITDSSWSVISQHVMSQAQAIADAFAQSQAEGEKAIAEVKEGIEVMLQSFGASEEQIKSFSGSIDEYLRSITDGFNGSYGELRKTEEQLSGLTDATSALAKETEHLKGAATDTYDELKNKQEGIKQKIDEINASPLNPQVKDEQLLYLRGLLVEINGLMKTAGTGSINAAREALDTAKKELDDAAFGSDAYKQAKSKYDKAKADYDRMYKATYGDKSSGKPKTKTTKSGSSKTDPKQIAYDVEEIQKQMQEKMDELTKDLQEAYSAGVTSAMEEGTKKQLKQIEDDTKNKVEALKESIKKLKEQREEEEKQIWLKKHPKSKEYEYPTPAEMSIEAFLDKFPSLKAAYEDRVKQINEAGEKASKKITDEQTKSETAAMNAYLEEYGTHYQKRQAIIDQYNEKIKEAEKKGLEGEVLSLKKQMNTALGDLDFSTIQKAFGDLFSGDLSQIPTDQLAAFKEQLEGMVEQAKELSPEQLQEIADVLGNMQTQMDLTNPIQSIKDARKEYKDAKKDFEAHMKAAKKARQAGDFEAEAKSIEKARKAQTRMNNAETKAKVSTERLLDVVSEFANTLGAVGDAIGGTTGEMLKLAASGMGAGVAMANGMKMFKEAADNASKSVAILAIIQAAFQAVMAIIDLFSGKEDKTLTAYVDAMDNYISMLTEAISDLKEEMNDMKNSMTETIAKYKELVNMQRESAEAIKAQSQVWLNSGASAKAHSEGYKIVKSFKDGLESSSSDVRMFYQGATRQLNDYFRKVYGHYANTIDDFSRMEWIWQLSDSDIKELAKNTKLLAALGDDLSEAIIKYADTLEELDNSLNEQYAALLSVSYDDFYSDFVDMVSDMDNTSAEFANHFGEYMRKALIQNLVANQYKDRIKKLYEAAGKAAENGTLEQELGALREEWTQIAKEAREEVKLINDISGTSGTEEDGSGGSWSALGEETGRALEGRMTAIHIQTTIIAEMMLSQGEKLTEMQSLSLQEFSMLTEMSNLVYISTNHLERISRNSDTLPSINQKLERIRQNTDRL